MSVGEELDRVLTRVHRATGQFCTMIVLKRLSRSRLLWVADELEKGAQDIRRLLTPPDSES